MGFIYAPKLNKYELIDAGSGKKLERWGAIITIRPDVNAYFKPEKSLSEWNKIAHASFIESSTTKGEWKSEINLNKSWNIDFHKITIKLRLTAFKHIGLFPEQNYNWDWIKNNISSNDSVLNLFGYTGIASLIAKQQKANVFHCDAAQSANDWAKENMELSDLSNIHWVTEDALKFAKREVKRNNHYTLIIMDPPAHGIGSNKKRWKIEQHFKALLDTALNLLHSKGVIIMNTYSPRLKEIHIKEYLTNTAIKIDFSVDILCIKTSYGKRLEYGLRTFIKKF